MSLKLAESPVKEKKWRYELGCFPQSLKYYKKERDLFENKSLWIQHNDVFEYAFIKDKEETSICVYDKRNETKDTNHMWDKKEFRLTCEGRELILGFNGCFAFVKCVYK